MIWSDYGCDFHFSMSNDCEHFFSVCLSAVCAYSLGRSSILLIKYCFWNKVHYVSLIALDLWCRLGWLNLKHFPSFCHTSARIIAVSHHNLFVLFKKSFFYYFNSVSLCISVCFWRPLKLDLQMIVNQPQWCCKLNSSPMQQQYMLLTSEHWAISDCPI